MAAGPLDKRVLFQREARVADGAGGFDLTWQDQLKVWGKLTVQRGSERLAAGQLSSQVPGVLTIRYSSDASNLTTGHRVLIDGVPHQIRAITNPDQQKRFLEFLVERGVAT